MIVSTFTVVCIYFFLILLIVPIYHLFTFLYLSLSLSHSGGTGRVSYSLYLTILFLISTQLWQVRWNDPRCMTIGNAIYLQFVLCILSIPSSNKLLSTWYQDFLFFLMKEHSVWPINYLFLNPMNNFYQIHYKVI